MRGTRAAVVAIGAELIMAGSFLLMPFVHHGISHATVASSPAVELSSLRHDCTEDMELLGLRQRRQPHVWPEQFQRVRSRML